MKKHFFLKIASLLSPSNTARGENLMFRILFIMKRNKIKSPFFALLRAITIVTPVAKIKPQSISGKTVFISYHASLEKRQTLAFNFIIKSAASRKGYIFEEKIAEEILAINRNEITSSLKMCNDIHKSIRDNRSFIKRTIKI